jgi:hypothetical protein
MKKITLFFSMLIFVAAANAQSLTAVSPSPSPLTGPPTSELDAVVGIMNSSSNPISVKVMRYPNLAPGHKSYYCWWINCYSDTVDLSPDSAIIAPGSANTDWSFHGKLDPQTFDGVSYVTYCFFDMYNPSDSICLDFTYDFTTGIPTPGVSSTNPLSNASPNPANNLTSINYDLGNRSDARLVIYNVLGSTVKEIKLNGKQGTMVVVTSDLGQGVYYYSLVSGDKIIATKKLVVAHR